jgi:formate dehydrogenase subunit gamma
MSAGTDAGVATRAATVRRIAEQHASERGPLLPVLHGVMDELGYIDAGDVPLVAEVLNLSVAEVHGVVSFYQDFRTSPAPAHTLHLCRAESCQALGSQPLYEDTRRRFAGRDDVEVGHVFCLGNCPLGPSGTVDGQLHGRLTTERITALTQDWQS